MSDAAIPPVPHDRLEAAGLEAWFHAARTTAVRLDPRVRRVASAIAVALPGGPSDFNRIVNLGLDEPASEAQLDELLATYRGLGVRFLVQLSDAARPSALRAWVEARGGRRTSTWAMLQRGADPPSPAATEVRVESVGPERAEEFGATILAGFGMPEAFLEFAMAPVGQPGFRHYLAYSGGVAVAAAQLYLAEGGGWIGGAATLPSHRGRGAQGALLAARVRDGLEAGCGWFVAETGEDRPEARNRSYHNMIRAGFQHESSRSNYVFDAT